MNFQTCRISPLVRDNRVIFWYAGEGERVEVIGSFNSWGNPSLQLTKGTDDVFYSGEIIFDHPGRYQYLFRVDGKEILDPQTFNKIRNHRRTVSFFDTWSDPAGMKDQFSGLKRELALHPLQGGDPWVRSVVLSIFDQYVQIPAVNRSLTMAGFIEDRIRTGIEVIKSTEVKKGVLLVAVYGMGFLIKIPDIVIGIDVVTGRKIWNLMLDIDAGLVADLSELMDILLVTHTHSDHFDEEIVEQMVKKGKLVWVPDSANTTELSDDYRIYGKEGYREYGGNRFTFFRGPHVYDQGRNIEAVSWLIETSSGKSIYHSGDIDYTMELPFYGRKMDITIPKYGGVSPYYENDRESLRLFSEYIPSSLYLPSHIGELSHYPGGGRESFRACLEDIEKLSIPGIVMLPGEYYRFD